MERASTIHDAPIIYRQKQTITALIAEKAYMKAKNILQMTMVNLDTMNVSMV